MFRDRAFNISILFSTAWHLFWMCAICVVVTPTVHPRDVYQEVTFLGPILEKTAFDLMVDNVAPQGETLYARSTLFMHSVYLKPKGPERKVLGEFSPDILVNRFSVISRGYMKNDKEIPTYVLDRINILYRDKSDSLLEIPAEGPAGNREVIFKPKQATVPKGLYSNADEYVVRLKFFISDNGIVYDLEPVISSGYPEIDLLAVKYLKGWRFSLPHPQEEKNIWGIVTVRVRAK